MASGAIVSEDLAKKFATEKDSPYEKWVRGKASISSARSMFPTCAMSS